jgi:endonuclease-3
MQGILDFGAGADVARLRDRLLAHFPALPAWHRPDPCSQLVLSLISSRTRDAQSLLAHRKLLWHFTTWERVARATPSEIEAVIADVRFADRKALQLKEALEIIGRQHPDFRLEFLGAWPVARAMAWLERLPGVGPKVAASTLNFSTLRASAFVVDTAVHRVLRRFGFVGPKASTRRAHDFIMGAAAGWGADDLDGLHMLLKQLGQTRCRALDPACAACPLAPDCRFHRQGGRPRPRRPARAKAVDQPRPRL